MSDLLTRFALASDAVQLSVIGGALWSIALVAAIMEIRRTRSRSVERLERVGWFPWTAIFLACAMLGGGLLATSLPVVIGNL